MYLWKWVTTTDGAEQVLFYWKKNTLVLKFKAAFFYFSFLLCFANFTRINFPFSLSSLFSLLTSVFLVCRAPGVIFFSNPSGFCAFVSLFSVFSPLFLPLFALKTPCVLLNDALQEASRCRSPCVPRFTALIPSFSSGFLLVSRLLRAPPLVCSLKGHSRRIKSLFDSLFEPESFPEKASKAETN